MCTDLENIIQKFIYNNNQFCSEKDFQFSLAWEIKSKLKNTEVILEYPYKDDDKIMYIDICVIHNGKKYFIELKYKTKKEKINRYGEEIELANQFAQDLGRYSFCKDIERLESIKDSASNYAIFLTNDSSYWTERQKASTLDCNFRIHENKYLSKNLDWALSSSDNLSRPWIKKYPAITLNNEYTCGWKNTENNNYRYLCLKISNPYIVKPLLKCTQSST